MRQMPAFNKTMCFLVIILWFGTYCFAQVKTLKPTPPGSSTKSYSYTQKESLLYIPVRLSLDTLTNLIKQHIPQKVDGTFAKDSEWIKDGKYSIHIPDVKHNVIDRQYQLDATFASGNASAFLGWNSSWGKLGETSKVENIKGTLFLQPRLGMDGYTLFAQPEISTHLHSVDLVACVDLWVGEVCSPGIPVTTIVQSALDYELQNEKRNIEKAVNKELLKVDLQAKMAKLWDTLYTPIPLDSGSNPIYVALKPTSLMMNPMHFDDHFMHFGLGIKTFTSVTDQPTKVAPESIPIPVNEPDSLKGLFNVNIPVDVEYTTIRKLLDDSLKNTVVHNSKGKALIKIKDLDFYGKDSNHFVLGLKVKGMKGLIKKVKGWIYLDGTLKFDPETYEISVDSFDLDSETNKKLLNAGVKMIADKWFYKKILKKLNYSYKDQLGKVVSKLDNKLKTGIETPAGKITGTFQNLTLHDLIFTEQKIHLDVEFSGKLDEFTLELHELLAK